MPRNHHHEPLTIQIWPLRHERWTAIAWLSLALLAGLLAQQSTGHIVGGVLASTTVLAAVWRVFVPVTVRLAADGVYQSVLGRERFCSWNAISWYRNYPNGVMLFIDKDQSVFTALRGLFIPFGKSKGEIVQVVETHFWQETSFEVSE